MSQTHDKIQRLKAAIESLAGTQVIVAKAGKKWLTCADAATSEGRTPIDALEVLLRSLRERDAPS